MRFPWALARAIPAFTRSLIKARSNWPSRSNEQIFYGKQEEPLAPKKHMMPYKAKKQCVA